MAPPSRDGEFPSFLILTSGSSLLINVERYSVLVTVKAK
jgi:hypothetical protein